MHLDWPAATALAWLVLTTAAGAQSLSVASVGDLPLGNVTSASLGTTTFTISASTGLVARSGGGSRLGSGSARSLVTIACESDGSCATSNVAVTISAVGGLTGRAGALGNFTISALTAQILTGPSGTDTLSFTMGPIGNNDTKTFYVGADFPILGDDSAAGTGPALNSFQVSVQFAPSGTPTAQMGSGTATVFRPITLTGNTDLAFGTISCPRSGAGSVAIDAATGERTLTGDGIIGIGASPHRATYTVTGEGGQTFSVTVPPSFVMTGPGDTITVAVTTTASGTQTLDGTLGSGGSASFGVGGSFSLPTNKAGGTYSGTFVVSVAYQ